MLKETLTLIGLCGLSLTTRIYAQQEEASPFHTIGETQKRNVMTMVEVLTDTTVQDSFNDEDTDMPTDSSVTDVPLMVALPLKDIHVNSPFGMRRDPMNRKKGRMHYGLDLRAKFEDVFSMLPGTVTAAGTSKAGGNYVTIDYGICTCSFLHLSKIDVVSGQHVSAGQKIATSGNTGRRTTGPHLHLSCRWSDTGKYFDPRILLKFITEQLMKLKIQ